MEKGVCSTYTPSVPGQFRIQEMSLNTKTVLKIAILTMFYAGIGNRVVADHTVVNDLECVRDADVITTTWTVADPSEKYGGDLEVEAEFTAHCSDDSKQGKAELKIHLKQDAAEIYSYRCAGSTSDGSKCTGKAVIKDVEATLAKAVADTAKVLCEDAGQSLLRTEGGEIYTDVKVKHLQKGEKVSVHCHSEHHSH